MAIEIPEKSWELSHYEIHRKAQSLITSATTKIAVSSKSVHSDLRCPICLDLLSTTMTTKECLHRFCAQCIITALRSGNKECPTCRKKLISKRSLRPDPNFDQLVSKLFPNKEEFEETQEKAGFAHAKRLCKKRMLAETNIEGTDLDLDSENSSPKKKLVQSIGLKLLLHPNVPETLLNRLKHKERFIETKSNATIDHLSAYIKTRLEIDLDLKYCNLNQQAQEVIKDIRLFSKKEDEYMSCLGKNTLEETMENKSSSHNGNVILEIFYSFDIGEKQPETNIKENNVDSNHEKF